MPKTDPLSFSVFPSADKVNFAQQGPSGRGENIKTFPPDFCRETTDRPGDNLYTDCVLALDAATGALKWHYQFTPHDVADRDAVEPNVLVDRVYRGKPTKLLLHADRNGFFSVLDRTIGGVLLATPFLRRIDWASSIGTDGRPVVRDPRGCPVDATSRPSVSKNSGYEMTTASAPSTVDGWSAASAAIAKAIAIR